MPKLLSKNEQDYYKNSLKNILKYLSTVNCSVYRNEVPASAICSDMPYNNSGISWELKDTPKMLQALNTLHEQGLVEKIKHSYNFTYWKISEKGIESLKTQTK